MPRIVQIGQFKAECLHLMAEVNRTKISLIVTKRSIPLVKISPVSEEKPKIFGSMKDTIEILGDIIAPIDEVWDADR